MPEIAPVPADHPDLDRLVDALVHEMAQRYGGEPGGIALPDPDARWLLLRDDDGTALGCGAVQPLSHTIPGAPADHGEVKRVYVVPAARGRGHSRTIMTGLLELASARGCTWVQLETGTEQPEAVALYERSGWTRIDNYGQYVEDPRSRCYGRAVPPVRLG